MSSSLATPPSEEQRNGRGRGKPRVSAEHTLNRVRENQRRHRARRKDYIATLEEKLKETEKLLQEARAELEVLRAEKAACPFESLEFGIENSDGMSGGGSIADIDTGVDVSGSENLDVQGSDSNTLATPTVTQAALPPSHLAFQIPIAPTYPPPPQNFDFPEAIEIDQPFHPTDSTKDNLTISSSSSAAALAFDLSTLSMRRLQSIGPPPCHHDEPSSPSPTPLPTLSSPECTTCATRPPPSSTESTTLCSQAYVLISEHNFKGVDAATIRMWLFQGFRRARREGEGCRVENGVLMSLLDFISGV
ncbi:hypothetical protein CC78DRAFT_533837 [Lojkania enalia]|uniref:BZIP domain-containing protein n=1 Tax=Lojkania enalia TaxID=147567 RepID=A0A9P4N825_9PLEO|nr:hypothetical protein CC78DRAFT_533837 [Didymosphaeria enalia]